jgi:hypothetical protein
VNCFSSARKAVLVRAKVAMMEREVNFMVRDEVEWMFCVLELL